MVFLEKLWNGRERREHRRVALDGPVRLLVGQTWQRCEIVNMSSGGAAFLAKHRPDVGQEVIVRIADLGLFKCRVLRHSAQGFAAAFEAADFTAAMPAAPPADQPELPFPTT